MGRLKEEEAFSKHTVTPTPEVRLRNILGPTPFAYLISDTYRNETNISAEEAQRRFDLVQKLILKNTLPNLDFLYEDPQYVFLEGYYPGLDVTGWRILMALHDPLTYGKGIQMITSGRQVSDRGGKR